MAQSLAQIYIHFIFHTKTIALKRNHLGEMWHFIAGIARTMNSYVVIVGGQPDHVHMLCTLPRTVSMSQFAEEIKRASSKWIKERDTYYKLFAWQRGYASFSVSQSKLKEVTNYINNQEEHHKKISFQDEYIEWLEAYGIEYDPAYVFSD